MVSIVHDYAAIAAAMKGDGWYQKAKPVELPKPEGKTPLTAMAESLLEKAVIVRTPALTREIKNRKFLDLIPNANAEHTLRLQREMEELRRRMIEFMSLSSLLGEISE